MPNLTSQTNNFQFSFDFRSNNKESIAALLVENTFTSIPDIARILFPFKLIKCLPGVYGQ